MKSENIKIALKGAIQVNRPVFIWGAPGVGKSDIVREVAKDLFLELRDIRAVLLDPVDLRGLPSVNNGQTTWNVPDFLPTSGRGILFLDELNAAPQMIQAACYQLILDRKLGDYTLPDGWRIVAAGNRETDRAIVHKMSSALGSRFVHLDFSANLESWVSWALANSIALELIAFLRFRPELLHKMDNDSGHARTFPTPRTWAMVSDILSIGLPRTVETEMIQGTVGQGAAVELAGFMSVFRTLPDPSAVLMDPENSRIPDDPATVYALIGALARLVTIDSSERFFKLANRFPSEYSVVMVRDAIKQTPSIQNTRGYIEWSSKNSDILI